MKYLNYFNLHLEYTDPTLYPNVSYCKQEDEVHYNPNHDYSLDYLTFNVISSGTITWKANSSSTETKTISYSLNNGETWTNITSSTIGISINVNTGDKILFKGTNVQYTSAVATKVSSTDYNTFSDSTADFNISGNIMSLVYGDNFINNNNLTQPYVFSYLFINTKVHNAKNLILPTTTLTAHCYHSMFDGCTNLTTVPELPATTLSNYCYNGMFSGCTSLTVAPALSATTLAQGCYSGMFRGCTSLTKAPELPSTTLSLQCYSYMFKDCTSLIIAPVLSATVLKQVCYRQMFYNCTNLNVITCLATDISASACTADWVNGVAASGTFIKAASMESWPTGADGIPSGWTIQNNT